MLAISEQLEIWWELAYEHAKTLQSRAEQGTDPNAYVTAADAYVILGLFSNANTCYRRAEHYRKIQREEAK